MPLFYKNKIRKQFSFLQSIGYHELNGDYKIIYYNDPVLCYSNGERKICFFYDLRENRFEVIIRDGSKIEDVSGDFITLSGFLHSIGDPAGAAKVSDLSKYKFKQALEESASCLKKYKMNLKL